MISSSLQPTSPFSQLLDAKRRSGQTVSVCIPAHNEEATIGRICAILQRSIRLGLIDELIVFDDRSTDDTAREAHRHGAAVLSVGDILPWISPGAGKGEVLWKSLWGSSGDIVVWVDGDILNFGPHFVTRLLAPMLTDSRIGFVKGHYRRPIDGDSSGGGRTTELAARPLISRYFPHLARFPQPLSGEFGGRREVLEAIPFVQGWGVDLGMLIDVSRLIGVDRMASADLGVRVHRNRPLRDLGPQAMAVQSVVLRRAGVETAENRGLSDARSEPELLLRPGLDGELEAIEIPIAERPPMRDVPRYLERCDPRFGHRFDRVALRAG